MMNFKIAIVGLDNTGKTTIAKGLSRLTGIPYFKDIMYKEKYFGNSDYAYMTGEFMLEMLRQTDQPIITDRCFWDEFVYGRVYGRPYKSSALNSMLKAAYELPLFTVYTYRDKIIGKDDIIAPSKLPLIKESYEYFMNPAVIPNLLKLDVSNEKIDEQLTQILRWIS